MQLPLKNTMLGRLDWRRGIFRGWIFALVFFLIFLFMPQVFAGLIAQGIAPVFTTLDGNQLLGVFSSAGIYILMALGLNVVVGFAGLLDLGYAAFFAIGADKSAPGKWIYRESPLAHFQWLASKYGYLGPWDADQFKPLQDKN